MSRATRRVAEIAHLATLATRFYRESQIEDSLGKELKTWQLLTHARRACRSQEERALLYRLADRVRTFFFDSHGCLWETCQAGEPGAENFGPTGIARECSPKRLDWLLGAGWEGAPYRTATKNGQIRTPDDEENGWDTCVPIEVIREFAARHAED